MRPHRDVLVPFLLLALAAAPPSGGAQAVPRPARFLFSGSVTEPGGRPVRDAELLLDGEREPAARTDADGRFSFARLVPDAGPGLAAPVRAKWYLHWLR